MSRQPSKSLRGSPPADTTAARPSRVRLYLAVLMASIAVAFLGYRIYGTLSSSRPAPRLSLGANVPLLDPPPLAGDDRPVLKARLERFSALRANAALSAGSLQTHLALAQAAVHSDDTLAAYEEFRTALHGNPQADLTVYNQYGLCALELALYPRAMEIYRLMVARWPDHADGYIGLSRAQYYQGNVPQSFATLDHAGQAIPADHIPDRLHIAYEFDQKGALERALTVAQSVLAVAPKDPLALRVNGELLFKLTRLAEARRLLEQLVAAHPEDTTARNELAAVVDNPLLGPRDRGLAESMLLQILQQDPNNAQAYTQLGTIYMEQGRYRQAAYIYGRLLQLTPNSSTGRMQLARAYESLGDARRAAAQRVIGQELLARERIASRLSVAVDRHPTDPATRLALGRYYVRSGQFSDALVQLQAAYCLAPDSAETRRALAALYDQVGVPALRADIKGFVK